MLFKLISLLEPTKSISSEERDEIINNIIKKHYETGAQEDIIALIKDKTGKDVKWGDVVSRNSRHVGVTRTVREINGKLEKLIIWTTGKERLLKKLWPTASEEELLSAFDIDKSQLNALYDRASQLGIKKRVTKSGQKRLSDTDLKLLESFYPCSNWEVLVRLFPDRTQAQIKNNAKKKKIRKLKRWTPEKKEMLIKYYPFKTPAFLEKLLGEDWRVIRNYAKEIGVKRKKSSINFQPNQGITATEKKYLKELFKNRPYYELYFTLPNRSYKSISRWGYKNNVSRVYKAQINMPIEVKRAITGARKAVEEIIGSRYERIKDLAELLKSEHKDVGKILKARDVLFDIYFEDIKKMAEKNVNTSDIVEFGTKDDAAMNLALSAFQASFEYIISWPVDNFLDISSYFFVNKRKMLLNDFHLTKVTKSNMANLSLENSRGDDNDDNSVISIDRFVNKKQSEDSSSDEFEIETLQFVRNILAPKDFMAIINFWLKDDYGEYKESYQLAIDSLSNNIDFKEFAESHNQSAGFLARSFGIFVLENMRVED